MLRSIGKGILPAIAGLFIIASCSSSKSTSTTASRTQVKGTWILDKITYEGIAAGEGLKLQLLDEGSDACLTGSTWVLPNNGYGSYTIASSQSGCIAGQKNIVWSYRKDGDQPFFQYKKLEGGVKAKNIEEGYRFRILSATGNAMVLQSEISYQGNPIFINYNFSKT